MLYTGAWLEGCTTFIIFYHLFLEIEISVIRDEGLLYPDVTPTNISKALSAAV